MDLSRGHLYKTIEEAKTAIKQYFKVHYFIRLIRPRRIKKFYVNKRNFIRRESPPPLPTNKKMLFVGNRLRRIKKKLFVGNRPRRIKKNLFVRIPDE